jgi:hypothetical protein
MHKVIVCFVIGITLVSVGCSTFSGVKLTPTPAPTPTPERLKLINGELAACLLVSSAEVETISGITVTSEIGINSDPTFCRYVSGSDGEVVVVTSVTTDATLKNANKPYSATESYEMLKMVATDMAERHPELFKILEIDNLGDQAYSREGTKIDINVLKSGIVYFFSTGTVEDGGIGYDALTELATIALQRTP